MERSLVVNAAVGRRGTSLTRLISGMVSFIVELFGASAPKRAEVAKGSPIMKEYPMTASPATMRRGED